MGMEGGRQARRALGSENMGHGYGCGSGRYGKAASALLSISLELSHSISGGRWISRRSSAIELMMMRPFLHPGFGRAKVMK